MKTTLQFGGVTLLTLFANFAVASTVSSDADVDHYPLKKVKSHVESYAPILRENGALPSDDGAEIFPGYHLDNYEAILRENGMVPRDHVGNIAPVPVPAALWLMGSGLLGLFGISRCRKA